MQGCWERVRVVRIELRLRSVLERNWSWYGLVTKMFWEDNGRKVVGICSLPCIYKEFIGYIAIDPVSKGQYTCDSMLAGNIGILEVVAGAGTAFKIYYIGNLSG